MINGYDDGDDRVFDTMDSNVTIGIAMDPSMALAMATRTDTLNVAITSTSSIAHAST